VSFDKTPVAIFPDIPFEVCDKCGDICFGPEGLEAIEKHKENFRQNAQGQAPLTGAENRTRK
jgi:hypothetical protein